MTGLLDPRTIRKLADEIGLSPTKQRGQNFVHDANTVRRIVTAAELTVGERVLEVGPGFGSLTLGLLEAGHEVIAVEIDRLLAKQLPKTVAEQLPDTATKLTIITGDALQLKLSESKTGLAVNNGGEESSTLPDALVANLPYNVSVPVILHVLATIPTIQHGLVMVQAEVADRLVATPGSKTYGVPSAKLAWYCDARRVGSVPAAVFWPVPNVGSGLVTLSRREPPTTSAARSDVFKVVDAAFAMRRKMLRSALAGLAGSAAAAATALDRAGIDPQARGETLDIAAFARLAQEL